jgi:energy-coupling factor transporter transmembrane protein EcfT
MWTRLLHPIAALLSGAIAAALTYLDGRPPLGVVLLVAALVTAAYVTGSYLGAGIPFLIGHFRDFTRGRAIKLAISSVATSLILTLAVVALTGDVNLKTVAAALAALCAPSLLESGVAALKKSSPDTGA